MQDYCILKRLIILHCENSHLLKDFHEYKQCYCHMLIIAARFSRPKKNLLPNRRYRNRFYFPLTISILAYGIRHLVISGHNWVSLFSIFSPLNINSLCFSYCIFSMLIMSYLTLNCCKAVVSCISIRDY